ncbi:hypothetical protein MYX76_18310, partial [Desulfobacterota bacterium AH_259_B03_O07]|nr:hypothetical protein [Desulfobacterota bacterium AH_259_B03_O07]
GAFTPCPTPLPDCSSPNFDNFLPAEIVRFCEPDPEDGGLVGEVTTEIFIFPDLTEETVATLTSRVPPSLEDIIFPGVPGPGDVVITCTVTGLTTCNPVGTNPITGVAHASTIFGSGGTFSFPNTGGTISLLSTPTFPNGLLHLMDITTTQTMAPPFTATSGCCSTCVYPPVPIP